ncbi:MAG TPA: DUF2306 domain-containing protein [Bacteroidia bacterium]|nr:DUF2306 domain-containing protein [Bacteroidia bacterium]
MLKDVISARNIIRIATILFFWTPIIFLSGLLVYNTIPYFTFSRHFSFLEAREALYNKWVWRWSFYLHIAAGSFCILSAVLQFSSWILRKRKKIHVVAGKIYVFVVLLIGAPSGFYMTFFAEGGTAERLLFMFMALFWFYSTLRGFNAAARDKDFVSHKYWMIRSYAMALTAVTFRVYHIIFYVYGFEHFTNYSVSLWISILGNALVAEMLIRNRSKNYLRTLTN